MKFLQLIADGSCTAYRAELADEPRFRVIEVEDGVNPQPDAFLSPVERAAKPAKPAAVLVVAPTAEPVAAPVVDEETLNLPEDGPALNDAPVFVSPKKKK